MNGKVYLRLTEHQRKLLVPLFKQVYETVVEGKKGLILGQINEGSFHGTFIPHKYAIKMSKIMEEMEEDSIKTALIPQGQGGHINPVKEGTMSDDLYDKALNAITELFNDQSVSREEAKINLDMLIGEIETMIESLNID